MDKQRNELIKSYFRTRSQANLQGGQGQFRKDEVIYFRERLPDDKILKGNVFSGGQDKAKFVTDRFGKEFQSISTTPINPNSNLYYAQLNDYHQTAIIVDNETFEPSLDGFDRAKISGRYDKGSQYLAYFNTKNLLNNNPNRFNNMSPFMFGKEKLAYAYLAKQTKGRRSYNVPMLINFDGEISTEGINDHVVEDDYSDYARNEAYFTDPYKVNEILRAGYFNSKTNGKYNIVLAEYPDEGENNLSHVKTRTEEGKLVHYLMNNKGELSADINPHHLYDRHAGGHGDSMDVLAGYVNSLLKKPFADYGVFRQGSSIEDGITGRTLNDENDFHLDLFTKKITVTDPFSKKEIKNG